ncbi:MAG: serine/threonine protein kinase [Polyangiaceae bacterium]|nr:serine/threonine protein kinase [Polyangiaceae bacterium]
MSSATPDLPDVPRPGDVLAGKYRVERILGAGGMGVVLAAWHLVLERRVAVKFLLPAAAQLPDAGARFLREARAAAALEGEHVARVLDVGTLDHGAPYMVLEHLQGADLAAVLKERGPLPISEAVDLLLQAGLAIAEAHARGILHRDLKPKNLFLTRRPDGTPLVKVLDFGLSKILQGTQGPADASLTATGLIAGSIHYMSPEQIRSLKHADARTDVWALGVIFYEMLGGRRPFQGEGIPAVAAAVIADTPSPISSLRPDVPPPLDAVVARCLEKDPARRIQTVTELARGLAPFGSIRGMQSFESIARLLPEAAAPTAAPARAQLPSFTGVDASPPRLPLPSSPSGEAAVSAPTGQTTRPVIAPSPMKRGGHARIVGVVLASAFAAATVAVALAWLFVVRAPDSSSAADSAPAAVADSAPAAVADSAPAAVADSAPAAAADSAPVAPPAPASASIEVSPVGPVASATPSASAPKKPTSPPAAKPPPKSTAGGAWTSALAREGDVAELASVGARLDVRELYDAAAEPAS